MRVEDWMVTAVVAVVASEGEGEAARGGEF